MILVPGKLGFIHVQKTGGMTITRLIVENFDNWQVVGRKHDSIRKHTLYQRDKYFMFAGVRNPWERLLSWHTMIMNGDGSNKWNDYVRHRGKTFVSFILDCIPSNLAMRCGVGQLPKVTGVHGKLAVDFLIRFETFTQDVIEAFSRLDIHLAEKNIPHENASSQDDYVDWYDDRMKNVVDTIYAKEIEFLGYRFGA